MRVAALYDIHGNLPALEAVLAEIRESAVDLIVVGGDVVAGPMPRETLECLLELDIEVRFIQGNADRVIVGCMQGIDTGNVPEQIREMMRWVAEQLKPEYEQVLSDWPKTFRLELPGLGKTLFCHATPRSDSEVFTRITPEERLLPIFEGIDASLVVCGHTHMQFDRRIAGIRVANAGSVGMPYGEPGAYWLLFDDEVRFRHTAYDLKAAAARIRSSNYPMAEDFAAHNVLQPPTAPEAREAFEPE